MLVAQQRRGPGGAPGVARAQPQREDGDGARARLLVQAGGDVGQRGAEQQQHGAAPHRRAPHRRARHHRRAQHAARQAQRQRQRAGEVAPGFAQRRGSPVGV